ncbi:hypothetical protein TanjilG_10312 [Lupinus angustifolius]|uniref:Uncharacterized protein n=1 Tax=Lupinus angustifolius TaxID=3871 RepID=A0A1J7FPN5_LUPAN|nr:hypothetical protein TanjilG_10312 [Lupinus angustifolius]
MAAVVVRLTPVEEAATFVFFQQCFSSFSGGTVSISLNEDFSPKMVSEQGKFSMYVICLLDVCINFDAHGT